MKSVCNDYKLKIPSITRAAFTTGVLKCDITDILTDKKLAFGQIIAIFTLFE